MKETIKAQVINILNIVPLAANLARKKFIAAFLLGLIDSRKVQFKEIAMHIDSEAKLESIERKVQSFFKEFTFDYDKVCLLLLMFLPKGKVDLCIDRTEWDFGKYQCNILMIVAKCGSIGIPLRWKMLDNKSGNSNWFDRCELLDSLIRIIGKDRINVIIGDREFIGIEWVKYLKLNNIGYCMRVPKNHLLTLSNGSVFSIKELLLGESERYFHDCMVDGVWGNSMLKTLPKGEFLFLIGSLPAKTLGATYRKRWSVEVLFQSFKDRGFDLESTHLKCSNKLSKLLVFVSIAVAICARVGEFHHQKVQKVKVKKHGYKANSFFRKGLDILRSGMKNPKSDFNQFWQNCLDSFVRWIILQITYSQHFIKILG
jgi:hypothetical protein